MSRPRPDAQHAADPGPPTGPGPEPGSGPEPGDPLVRALRRHGARIRAVRYRRNRSVLLSVSRDGRTLNSHACFREAPPYIADAVARFVVSRRGSARARSALAVLREWEGTRQGLARARKERPRGARRRTDGPETAPLRRLFRRLNRDRFHGELPEIPLRVSRRMTRALGTISYGASPGNGIRDIAISADLLLPANVAALEETMLHEMAHAEAWLRHGHRGHGPPWRRIAVRVGCLPRALSHTPIRRRTR